LRIRPFASALVFSILAVSVFGQGIEPAPLPQVDDPMPAPQAPSDLPVFRTATTATSVTQREIASNAVTTNLVTGDAGDIYLATPPTGTAGVFFDAKTTGYPNLAGRLGTSDTASNFQILSANNASLLLVRAGDGRVGVGTISPLAKFSAVYNTTFPVGGATQSDTGIQGLVYQAVAAGASNPGYVMGSQFQAYNSGSGFLQDAFGMRIYTGNYAANTGTISRAFALRLRISNDAGTITDGYGLYIDEIPSQGAYAIYTAGADDRVYLGGNVGIGMGPTVKFEVNGTAAVYGTARRVARLWDSTDMASGVGAGMDFLGRYNATTSTQFANIKGVKANGTSGDFDGHFVVSVNDDGQMFEAVRIARNLMTVTGNAHFTGTVTGSNISATYQDVAEWVPTTQDLAPGTVVVLDATVSNHVVASTRPYDTTVAGVVSPQPGLILGIAGPEKAMIATTGRVKVRVDATAGPIAIGDLLVTGTKSGSAMKSQPVEFGGIAMHRPGTVVGKALEPLAGGEGEILVLLSLQ
jgi:hypothetical protein